MFNDYIEVRRPSSATSPRLLRPRMVLTNRVADNNTCIVTMKIQRPMPLKIIPVIMRESEEDKKEKLRRLEITNRAQTVIKSACREFRDVSQELNSMKAFSQSMRDQIYLAGRFGRDEDEAKARYASQVREQIPILTEKLKEEKVRKER